MDTRYSSSVMMSRIQSTVSICSIALSVYGIFTPVLNRECILVCMQHNRLPNPMLYVIKCMQLILHLTLSTGLENKVVSIIITESSFLLHAGFN